MPSPDPAGVEIRMMRDADLPEAIALLRPLLAEAAGRN